MKLYHGSTRVIEKPLFGYGKPYNDYGSGFYCTEELAMAKEWGVSNGQNGFANCYELDCVNLSILNLNDACYCVLHWLAILLENREFDIPSVLALEAKEYLLTQFLPDYKKFDAIIGYRADDSYFSFAQDFLNGTISYRQLSRAMYLGKLGQQFVLKSQKAFDQLQFTGYEIAEHLEWYAKKSMRDANARREYLDKERAKREKGDIYITQIIDEGMREDDVRLR